MRRFIIILSFILLLCGSLFYFSSMPRNRSDMVAVNGKIELSGEDFDNLIFPLKGQWEFYYGNLYMPENFVGVTTQDRTLITLPTSWESEGYPALGCATYRLVVTTGSERMLMMHVPEIISSSVIWINGEQVFSAGQPSTEKQSYNPSIRNDFVPFLAKDGRAEIVIQTANYSFPFDGLKYEIKIGTAHTILQAAFRERVLLATALGGILLIGLYHFLLYMFRRQDKVYLAFGVLCVLTVLRVASDTNGFVQYFAMGGMDVFLGKIYYLLNILHVMAIIHFMLIVFEIKLDKILKIVYAVCYALPIIAVLAFSLRDSTAPLFIFVIPFVLTFFLAVKPAMRSKNPYMMLYLASIVLYIFYGTVARTVFDSSLFIPGIVSNLFMVLAQCAMLSQNYADAHNKVEQLNANLESLVDERTEQLTKTNEKLNVSQTALREMIGNISHDLKTPLTALNNYLEMLGDDQMGISEAEKLEYLGIAYNKNLDLQRLIQNLFEVTRMESGNLLYNNQWVSSTWLLKQTMEKYKDYAKSCGIAFSTEGLKNFEISIDADKIWSVFDNIIYNAIRHTGKGGEVKINSELRMQNEESKALVTVSDTGCGIAPEHLPHIFERFYKVSKARGKKDGSSGLGLYIVKTSVEKMGGAVFVQSQEGKGTEFTLVLAARESISQLEKLYEK